jgi:regulator of sirC expression with transglutaminase-like and TPR domain
VKPSVVVISITGREGERTGLGTGFILHEDGLVATNLHVVGEARPIDVRLADGRTFPVVEVVATDRTADLAIVRIDARGLTPLPLGDSDALRQGQAILALGHPLGLEASVVQGVVSALREDVLGQPMIQLAIPIERGNSGGPVLDLTGHVHGLVTLKSQESDNLGYAVPINALKPLLAHPAPIPMARWLTIGVLNPRLWQAPDDVRWSQRAGQIHVEGRGAGFGGRSLCLWKRDLPDLPREVAVTVRLEQEDGAAGLIFHADGGDRHYGFYPSGGRLRLSRFDGPDVFSWHVLEETASPAYWPGEWNRLRVRLTSGRIDCYCNDTLVITSTDTGLMEGQVGLAKFRHTTAAFKSFDVSSEARSPMPWADVRQSFEPLLASLPEDRPPLEAHVAEALRLASPPTASRVLEEERRALERRAERIRQLAQAVHAEAVVRQLLEVFADDRAPVDLARAALLVAALDNEELDVAAYLNELDLMADELRQMIPEAAGPRQLMETLHRYLFEEMGFHGSRTEYESASNSYFNEVLDDREGLPITLSVLYLSLAARIGLKAEGVGLPGHFVVRVHLEEDDAVLVDAFDRGRELSGEDARRLVRTTAQVEWQDEYLAAVEPRAIVVRILRNLLRRATETDASEPALRYVCAVLALEPESAVDRLLRAVICYKTGRVTQGLEDADWLLKHETPGIPASQVMLLKARLLEQAGSPAPAGR